eukprot:gene11236-12416_t
MLRSGSLCFPCFLSLAFEIRAIEFNFKKSENWIYFGFPALHDLAWSDNFSVEQPEALCWRLDLFAKAVTFTSAENEQDCKTATLNDLYEYCIDRTAQPCSKLDSNNNNNNEFSATPSQFIADVCFNRFCRASNNNHTATAANKSTSKKEAKLRRNVSAVTKTRKVIDVSKKATPTRKQKARKDCKECEPRYGDGKRPRTGSGSIQPLLPSVPLTAMSQIKAVSVVQDTRDTRAVSCAAVNCLNMKRLKSPEHGQRMEYKNSVIMNQQKALEDTLEAINLPDITSIGKILMQQQIGGMSSSSLRRVCEMATTEKVRSICDDRGPLVFKQSVTCDQRDSDSQRVGKSGPGFEHADVKEEITSSLDGKKDERGKFPKFPQNTENLEISVSQT